MPRHLSLLLLSFVSFSLACSAEPASNKSLASSGGSGATPSSGGAASGGETASGGALLGGTAGVPGSGGVSGVTATGGFSTGGSGTGGLGTGGVGAGGVGTGGLATGGLGTGGLGTGGGSTGGVGLGGTVTGGLAGTGGEAATGGGATGGVTTGGSDTGGVATGGASTGGVSGPGTYALPPPSQCHNQDYIDYQEGCIEGDAASVCGGRCNTINACLESSAEKPYADVTFICPRFMLFSDQMRQAALDDGNAAFNYAVVGHDVDRGGVDGTDESTCCQCYQLVYAWPSVNNERQVQLNPDNPVPPASAIPLPKPLIVQSFNTAATPHTFDVYMAAGGLGANNACAPDLMPAARSGQYLYTGYPAVGQTSQGGVKPVTHFQECKNSYNWVTTETLSSTACQDRVAASCNEIVSDIPGLTEQSRASCIEGNDPSSAYHMNWSVYVKKVECPAHLTEVTGCKLAPQGLPPVDGGVTTAAQAATATGFWSSATNGQMYETTTMEDCCRPSCASRDWIEGRGLTSDAQYNAFYSCDGDGVPITE